MIKSFQITGAVLLMVMTYGTLPRTQELIIVQEEPIVEECVVEEEVVEEEPVIQFTPCTISNTSAKTYMDYHAITNHNSAQWRLIHDSGLITITDEGFLVDAEGRYGVALGSYFGKIGTKVDFKLENGTIFRCIKVESKADNHTNNGFQHKTDGSVIEFVLDTKKMNDLRGGNGLICNGNLNNLKQFNGNIVGYYICEE